jgi:hypothetical protein
MTAAEGGSENLFLIFGAGLMGMIPVYALATEVFRVPRAHARVVFVGSIAAVSVALLMRFIRLNRAGGRLLIFRLPLVAHRQRLLYRGWLAAAAIVNAYSLYLITLGEYAVGLPSCAVLSILMWVLAIGLTRPSRP